MHDFKLRNLISISRVLPSIQIKAQSNNSLGHENNCLLPDIVIQYSCCACMTCTTVQYCFNFCLYFQFDN